MSIIRSLRWQLLILNVRFAAALLIFIWIHSLCSSSHHLTIGALATAMSGQFVRPLHVREYSRCSTFPQLIGSRTTMETSGADAASKFNGLATPRRDLRVTSSGRSGHKNQIYASSNSNEAVPDVEVKALLAVKAAITSDPSNALRTLGVAANDSDTCTGWVGVTCSAQFPNHVVALNLSDFQLVGDLDSVLPTLGQLQFLQSLDLSVNFFTGAIQGESLTNFSRLSYFNVSQDIITGEIPSEIGELVRLQDFDVSHNHLSGLISQSLGNCSSLRFIDVALNALKGDIPASLGALSRLLYLNVSGNFLSGSIPGSMGNCSSLLQLDVTDNIQLVGVIPPEMGGLKQLQVLKADNCDFSGDFPRWIVNLTSLTYVSLLDSEHLKGEIPDTIGQLPYLAYFSVGGNSMTGVIPLSVCNLTSLLVFEIPEANISGTIPTQIGTLPRLATLNLISNKFTGVIPPSLGKCSTLSYLGLGVNPQMDAEPIPPWIGTLTNLYDLYLTGMNLQGPLPQDSFGMLPKLQTLTLADNSLTGGVPTSLQNCSYLYALDLGENYLTGSIPSELGELKFLYVFSVAFNYLTGPFPTFISNWTQLFYFQLEQNSFSGPLDGRVKVDGLGQLQEIIVSSNNFEGPIPEAIGNSSTIIYVELSDNRLSGVIPVWLGNMTSLRELFLSGNRFYGQIPGELFQSGLHLTGLDLSGNELEGTIPFEIGQFFHLTRIYLDDNNLMGILPSSLGNCTTMRYMSLSNNQFEGNISVVDFSRMSGSLVYLDLAQNRFSGSWPRELSALSNVQIINVSFNNIAGSIPLGLGQCDNLQTLDVSSNNLTGTIPQDLGSLKLLQWFNASYDDFTGAVPHSNSSQINESSFLGNPGLCGAGVVIGQHQECAAVPQNVSTHDRDCNGFHCKQIWIPVAVVSSVVLVVTILVVMGISSRWSVCRGGRDDNSDMRAPVMLNFGTHRMKFPERDVLQAIDDPHGENVIGRGDRSIVYKGVLPGGKEFALKKILADNDGDNQHPDRDIEIRGADNVDNLSNEKNSELLKEAEILAKLRHKNIVMCLSFYSSLDHKALILEYMSGGSLHQHLHGMETCTLTWQTRLKIAVGVAQGLKYLHHDFPEPLIHRDLKPSNVLLDVDFEPKISDFGISKFVGARKEEGASASTFCGTIGYMPPEYASQPWVSTKGDVYSYGMVLVELLTRKQPCSDTIATDDQGGDLRNRVLHSFSIERSSIELLDPPLIEECGPDDRAMEQMMLLLRVSLFCTRVEPQSRPSMINVIGMLTHIINLGVEPIVRRTVEALANTVDEPTQWPTEDPSIEGAEFGSSG